MFDSLAREVIASNPNMLVPWWFIGAYSYTYQDHSLISDALFDEIAVRLDKEWSKIKHPHKQFLRRKVLKSSIAAKQWPSLVIGACGKLQHEEAQNGNTSTRKGRLRKSDAGNARRKVTPRRKREAVKAPSKAVRKAASRPRKTKGKKGK